MTEPLNDTYKTLGKPTDVVLHKERNSKFYAYAFPLGSPEAATGILNDLEGRHRKASHLCYAWQWGVREPIYRVYDDGEPNNSAGMPIYGQIQSFGLNNVLVGVVRIFGGTKLGVGLLMQSYRSAAALALEAGEIVEKTLLQEYGLSLSYDRLDLFRHRLRSNGGEILHQEFGPVCRLRVGIPLSQCGNFETWARSLPGADLYKL